MKQTRSADRTGGADHRGQTDKDQEREQDPYVLPNTTKAMSSPPRWSEQEVEILRAEWKTSKPAREIAERLGRPLRAVYIKAHHLGLPKKDDPNKIKLSQSDQWWLRQNYPHMRTKICALKLGISLRSCIRLARKLGVEKTAQFMKETQGIHGTESQGESPRPRYIPTQRNNQREHSQGRSLLLQARP